MTSFFRSRTASWLALALILLAAVAVVATAPAERTLGQAVRVVYVHVALSRAGAIGITLAGLLGLVVLVTAGEQLNGWMRAIAWAGLILAAAGFGVSIAAQMVSWGGIAWREPRVVAAANVLALAVIVQLLNGWLPWPRLRATLHALVTAFQFWVSLGTANVLHPGNAISGSSSPAIQSVGVALLALGLLLGAWIAWQFRLHADRVAPA